MSKAMTKTDEATLHDLLDQLDSLNRRCLRVLTSTAEQLSQQCAEMEAARAEFERTIKSFATHTNQENPLFRPLYNLVAFEDPEHDGHEALLESYQESCHDEVRHARGSDLKKILLEQAAEALDDVPIQT